jgi:hypothetical protein
MFVFIQQSQDNRDYDNHDYLMDNPSESAQVTSTKCFVYQFLAVLKRPELKGHLSDFWF